TALRVGVGRATPDCGGDALTIQGWAGDLLIPARGSTTVLLSAFMPADAPDSCVAQRFPLTYSGDAQPARIR
ncbi:MAG: hypothetical protein ACLGHT_09100, partial [Acidimicrobiia bacterium]